MQLERLGRSTTPERDLCHVNVLDPADVGTFQSPAGSHFAALVIWDSDGVPAATIGVFARRLLESGCVYVCTWGRGCERLHDIFDEEIVDSSLTLPSNSDAMTSWHSRDDLETAIWYSLTLTTPADNYSKTCRSGLVVTVGQDEDVVDVVRSALQDSASFIARESAREDEDGA
jgi:hypothetical protein